MMEGEKKSRKKAIIEDVITEPKKIQPICVNFRNVPFQEDMVKEYECNIFHNKTSNETILGITKDEMVYKGCRPDLNKELMSTMIGIYNKDTNTIKLIEYEHWDVTPVLGNLPHVRTEFDEKAIAAVNKEFGSKKSKRRTEQFEKMQINVNSVKTQLEDVVASINVETLNLAPISNDDFTTTHLPSCNREATSIFDVYNIYDIIPKNMLKSLYDLTDNIIENGFKDNNSFFSNLLDICKKSSKVKKNVAILIYLQAICKWLEAPIKFARRIDYIKETFGLPEEVAIHLLNNYTVQSQSGRLRPPMIKDKATIHCMVLTLIINNYIIDLELFGHAIKIRIGVKKVIEFAKLLCLTAQKEKNVFSLKLPLPPQPVAVKLKRIKRR